MGARKLAGFTIIETMLVVSISGLLVVSLLVGVSVSLNQQRYKDATETFKSLLQQQFADLSNVQNSRGNNWSCDTNAAVSAASGTAAANRGQSNCILIGKYVQVNKSAISVYKVIGYKFQDTKQNTDIKLLNNNYNLNVVQNEVENSSMEWGTEIAYPASTVSFSAPTPIYTAYPEPQTPRRTGLLFIRSPDSGQIYTFTTNYSATTLPSASTISSATLKNMIVSGNTTPGQKAQSICIGTNGLFKSNDRAVYLNSFASGASAIEVQSNDSMVSDKIGVKC